MPAGIIFSLSDITARLGDIFGPHEQKKFWVQAEVAGATVRGGNLYATLVEFAGQKQVARLECVIWNKDLLRIQTLFRKADLHFELVQGMKACLQCHLSFHAVYGLKLVAVDADPRVVIGELELRKRDIIERLQKDGADKANKKRNVPALPLRLGIITSRDSAAFNDVVKTLRDSGYGFTVLLADALMQGDKAEASLLRAFAALERLAPDLLIVARGGGNKTELASLDSEALARRIADCTIPVWTAIGHEIDSGVLDLVAHTAHKTPTALAEAIVKRFADARHFVGTSRETLRREWEYRIAAQWKIVGDDAVGIRQGSRKLREYYRSALLSQAERVHLAVTERFAARNRQLAVASERLRTRALRAMAYATDRSQLADRTLRAASEQRMDSSRQRLLRTRVRLSFERVHPLLDRERSTLARSTEAIQRGTRAALLLRRQREDAQRKHLRGGPVLSRLSHLILLNQRHARLVEAHDPVNTLKRGFAIVTDAEARIVKSVRAVRADDHVHIAFHDGEAAATISNAEEPHGR